MKPISLKKYFEQRIFRISLIIFVFIFLAGSGLSLLMAHFKLRDDLQVSARSSVDSFRSRILEGDDKAVERAIRQSLNLADGEKAYLLNQKRELIYRHSYTGPDDTIDLCSKIDEVCAAHFFGRARIVTPIYFDDQRRSIQGYLFIERNFQINWNYFFEALGIFLICGFSLFFAFRRTCFLIFRNVSEELEVWSAMIRNPKEYPDMPDVPFLELESLKSSFEKLKNRISEYESDAVEKTRVLLLRGIGHDLINPIMRCQLLLATLEIKLVGSENNSTIFQDMKRSLAVMSGIASQVKMLVGENCVERPPANFIEAALEEMGSVADSPLAREKKLKVTSDVRGNHAPFTTVSSIEVARIVHNLLENAMEASPAEALIDVAIDAGDNEISLSVRNRGLPIKNDLKSKIFDPGYSSKRFGGTGLGLYIVKHICELNNGSVRVESHADTGTEIIVSIPRVEEVAAV